MIEQTELIQQLQKQLETITKQRDSARRQREQYITAWKAGEKRIEKLEKYYEIVVAHNLVHMAEKADLQDRVYKAEIKAFYDKLDRNHLLNW